jgi:hypothetical protein
VRELYANIQLLNRQWNYFTADVGASQIINYLQPYSLAFLAYFPKVGICDLHAVYLSIPSYQLLNA